MDFGATTYDAEQQRMDALATATEIRRERARMKREIKAGRLRIVNVIMDPPWYAESMYVMHLLMAMPKFGRSRAKLRMDRAELPLTKTVGSLTDRQRRVLVEAVGL